MIGNEHPSGVPANGNNRSSLTFNLSSVTSTIVAADISLMLVERVAPAYPQTIELKSWDGTNNWNAMGNGAPYGSVYVTADGRASITLNAAGLAYVNANLGGSVRFGVSVTDFSRGNIYGVDLTPQNQARLLLTFAPDVTLTAAASDPTNASFIVTATFTKPVTGLAMNDFVVTNGAASEFTALSSTTYTVRITPSGDGEVTITLPASAAQDEGNGSDSTASNVLTRQIDTVRPGVTLASASSDPTNGAFTVTASFTKPVTGLVLGDFAVTSGTASNLTGADGDDSYTVTITPTGDGAVSVSLPEAAASDAAGNTSTASNVLTRQINTTSPELVSIEAVSGTSTNGGTQIWRVTFSEAMAGVDASDFEVSGLTGASVSVTDLGGASMR